MPTVKELRIAPCIVGIVSYLLTKSNLTSPSAFYIAARIITLLGTMGFSVYYSVELGVVNRSIFTLIVTSSLIVNLLFFSGISLRFLKESPEAIFQEHVISFVTVIIGAAITNGAISFLLLQAFGRLTGSLVAPALLVTSVLFSLLSTTIFALQEALVWLGKFRFVSVMDLFMLFAQVFLFFFFSSLQFISTIVCILVSLVFAYIFSCAVISFSIFKSYPIRFGQNWRGIQIIYAGQSNIFFTALSNRLSGRVERIFIGFISPGGLLAQFSIIAQFASLLSSMQEAFSRVLFVNRQKFVHQISFAFWTSVGIALFSAVFLVEYLIQEIMGESWLLPTSIIFLILIQEFLRALWMSTSDALWQNNQSRYPLSMSILNLLVIFVVFPILFYFFGIEIALISNCSISVSYIIFLGMRNEK